MPLHILFWLLAIGCCAYAAAFGGRDGRWACFLIIFASLMTLVAARYGPDWEGLEVPRLVVDATLLAAFYVLALHSRSFWPLWITGFHLIAVTTHLSVVVAPGGTPALYRAMESFWAIPVLLSMVFGVHLDRRYRSGRISLS